MGDTMAIDRGALLLGGLVLSAAPGHAAAPASPRIGALIARMTIAEKAGHLSCFVDTVRPLGRVVNPGEVACSADAMFAEVRGGRVGMPFKRGRHPVDVRADVRHRA